MHKYKVIICGSVNYSLTPEDVEALDQAKKELPIDMLIVSPLVQARRGVGSLTTYWAQRRRVPVVQVTDEELYQFADAVIAFPGEEYIAAIVRKMAELERAVWDWRHLPWKNPNA